MSAPILKPWVLKNSAVVVKRVNYVIIKFQVQNLALQLVNCITLDKLQNSSDCSED